MYMRALVDISSTVGVIPKGAKFYELNPVQAEEMIKQGVAESLEPAVKAAPKESVPTDTPTGDDTKAAPSGPNSRGWDGLHWDGATVVIIGSGPSLSIEQTEKVLAWRREATDGNRRVIAINTSFRLAPWADILYACDGRWWNAKEPGAAKTFFEEASETFAADRLWTQDKMAADKLGLRFIQSIPQRGLSKTPGLIHQGNNSGYQAVNLAYLAGATRIILLGFDMRGGHWHGDHPPPLSSSLPHITWINNFTPMSRDLKEAGVDVVNATAKTALKCFPLMPLEEALA